MGDGSSGAGCGAGPNPVREVTDDALVEMILWLRARRMFVVVPLRGPAEFRRKRLDQR